MNYRNKFALLLLPALCTASAWAETTHGALVLPVQPLAADTSSLLEPASPAWTSAKSTLLHFNRTPPLYEADTPDDGSRPEVSIRLLRLADGTIVVRAQWTDPTVDLVGKGATFADAGEAHIHKKHSLKTGVFPDAFCAMVPVKRGPHAVYPSMMMGEAKQPVDLYFWKAGIGFQLLGAHGRASTAGTKTPLAGKRVREGDQWTVTMALPNMEPGTPVCFAVWDGAKAQRDGLKYFSLWYEVK